MICGVTDWGTAGDRKLETGSRDDSWRETREAREPAHSAERASANSSPPAGNKRLQNIPFPSSRRSNLTRSSESRRLTGRILKNGTPALGLGRAGWRVHLSPEPGEK